jgi:hypothetical protein
MIYEILNGGGHYSYHTSREEAEAYLLDLRRVYPLEEWDLEPYGVGRLPGQDRIHWGAECVVNLLTLGIEQWAKIYLWPRQFENPQLPLVGEETYLWWPLQFESTSEGDGVAVVRRIFKNMEFTQVEGYSDRVRRVR